jgi:hypothetical protein
MKLSRTQRQHCNNEQDHLYLMSWENLSPVAPATS